MSKYRIKLDGKVYEMEIERVDADAAPKAAPAVPAAQPAARTAPVTNRPQPAAAPAEAAGNAVRSPMPGTILRVGAAVGDAVKKGQSVLVLEAMKMESDIAAPADGKLKALYVAEGDTVQGGAPLFEIEA